jgi:CelD/BcsL family acetyltransferase involved in cellulose biosynthesis
MSSALRVHLVSSLSALQALEPEWRTLEAHAVIGEWFAGPDYVLPLLKTYFDSGRLAVYCVYDGDELIGVLPLVHQTAADVAGCRPTIGFPMHAHVRRIGLIASQRPMEVMMAIFREIQGAGHSCVALQQVESSGEFDTLVRQAATAAGLRSFDVAQSSSAIATWSSGWEDYLRTRDGKLLRNLRSRRRKLDEARFTVQVVRTPEAFADAWPTVLDVETRCWKHMQRSSMANEAGTATFYEEVGQRLARSGSLRLYLLRQEGTAVAHAFGSVRNRAFSLLKNSYDEAFKSWSPGVSLVWQSMQDAAEEGCAIYDFLGDASDWKRDFCTAEPEYLTRRLFAPFALRCQLCRLREETLKPFARRSGLKRLLQRAAAIRG